MPPLSLKAKSILFAVVLVLIIGTTLVYVVYLSPTGLKAKQNSDLGKVERALTSYYTTLDGTEVHMDTFQGELLIVYFWASWSPFTENDLRVLGEVKKALNERITVRAINRKESTDTAVSYLDTIGRVEGIEYVLDTTDYLYTVKEGYAMPETLIFNGIGNEVSRVRGALRAEVLWGTVHDLLKSKE